MSRDCTECNWSLRLHETETLYCCNPRAAVVVLTGRQGDLKPVTLPSVASTVRQAQLGMSAGECGPKGAWFEPLEIELIVQSGRPQSALAAKMALRRPAPYRKMPT